VSEAHTVGADLGHCHLDLEVLLLWWTRTRLTGPCWLVWLRLELELLHDPVWRMVSVKQVTDFCQTGDIRKPVENLDQTGWT